MLNRICLVGRLVADPEIRNTTSGIPVANFRIAVDRPTRNRETGDKETDFINIVAFRQAADFVSQYIHKGRLVSVDGRLQIRNYTTQDGQKRTVAEVVADSVQGLDRARDPEGVGYPPAPTAPPVDEPVPDDSVDDPFDGE